MSEPTLPFDDDPMEPAPARPAASAAPPRVASAADRPLPDQPARDYAVSATQNVVLEASAGTGKTRVLVERYVNLLLAGVEPDNILAITFTRKAAAEMRQRIVERLKEASRTSQLDAARWRDLRDRLADIAISTIDAFCLSLLREFPLEADVDPAFDMADDTEVPRLVSEALDQTLRICRARAKDSDEIALVFAQLGERRLRTGLDALLNRRLVAPDVMRRYLAAGPRDLTAALACRRAAVGLRAALAGAPDGVDRFLACGPLDHPRFAMLAADIRQLVSGRGDEALDTREGQAAFRSLMDRLRAYFMTQEGEPRKKGLQTPFRVGDCASKGAYREHVRAVAELGPQLARVVAGFRRDLNVVLARGVWQIFAVALDRYKRTLDSHALLDFPGVLERALELLRQMDEFARSRYRLESRYHHVLVDEFQDTSRAQWELVAQLVRSWGEGLGAASGPLSPSIFIVGDRKQSIYGFRDADVAVLEEAAGFIQKLRPEGQPRQAISVSFRSRLPVLAFVNDLFAEIAGSAPVTRRDQFLYQSHDRFPLVSRPGETGETAEADAPALGIAAAETVAAAADAVGDEVVRLLTTATVRDRASGTRRPAGPADIAILFRSRDSHRDFETALERRGVSVYVYKGLGFFESDEIQDVVSLLRYLADPGSDLRAAAFLRSRFVRLSDGAIARLERRLASAIVSTDPPAAAETFTPEDRAVLAWLRDACARWRGWVDRLTPAELLDAILDETAYAFEMHGARRLQARENLKKLRALVRRIQNRGYATLQRIADHLDGLAVGDESNAAIDAVDAVSLMTVHAAKGLEFPIVFVVNMGRGTGGAPDPIRVSNDASGEAAVSIADFQSEADEDSSDREREESKRLLYVAVTRARDRLYLASTVKDGVCRPGRGSLAEVLPKPVVALFGAAATAAADPAHDRVLAWSGQDGRGHQFIVCPAVTPDRALTLPRRAAPQVPVDAFGAIVGETTTVRLPVLRYLSEQPAGQTQAACRVTPERDEHAIVAGTLAHLLFATAGGGTPDELRARARAWLSDRGVAAGFARADVDALVDRALTLCDRLRRDPRVAAALASGRAFYEVPFALALDDRTIVRGSIDCLVQHDAGRATVIELKTGASREQHEAQLGIYLEAARTLLPGAHVEGLLVYADDARIPAL